MKHAKCKGSKYAYFKSSRRELFISYPRPQNCSFTLEKAQNKRSTVFAETVGFVFVYNKGSGIHLPQTFFIDFMSAKKFWGCNVNYLHAELRVLLILFKCLGYDWSNSMKSWIFSLYIGAKLS